MDTANIDQKSRYLESPFLIKNTGVIWQKIFYNEIFKNTQPIFSTGSSDQINIYTKTVDQNKYKFI